MRGSLRGELFGGLVDRKVSLLRTEARDSSIVDMTRVIDQLTAEDVRAAS